MHLKSAWTGTTGAFHRNRLPRGLQSLVLLCALFLVLVCPPRAQSQQVKGYSHQHWDIEEGAPPDIRAIAQTRDGFLWLGTSNGLYRFDGLTFEKIEPATYDRWRSNQITALAAAPDGALWVGYDFGGVGVYRNGRLEDANAQARPRGSVWDVIVSRAGDVWVSVNGSNGSELRHWHKGRWTSRSAKDWLEPEPVQSLYEARDGTLWIAQFKSILRLAPGAPRPEKIPEQVGFATAFAEDEQGILWLVSARGLQRLTPPRTLRPFSSNGPSAGGAGRRSLLFEDGLAWMAGHQEGIIRLPNLKSMPGGRDVIPVRSRVLYRDREGTIWGGGTDGLVSYIRSPIFPLGLKGAPTTGFMPGNGPGAPVFVATDAGVYRLSRRPPEMILKELYVSALCAGPPDLLLAIGLHKPLLRKGGVWSRYAGPPGVNAATDCAIDRTGRALISVPGGGVFALDHGKWTLQPGWPDGQIMVSDGRDGFYLNQPMRAVEHARPGSVRTLWEGDQIAIGFVRLLRPIGGFLYLGGEKGLARYDGKRFIALEARYNPWLSGISGIAIDRADVWLIGSEGIFRITRTDFEKALANPTLPIPHQVIGARLGLNSRSFSYVSNDAVTDADGNPMFVTNRGIVRVDPARIVRNPVAPPVVIRGMEANGNTYLQGAVTLPAGTSRVQFDYVALSLTSPAANRYRYRLDGVDGDWVDAGNKRQASYTALGPGTFRFRVIAANPDGVWNTTGASMSVTIEPYFWQTWWFEGAVGLIVAVTLWALVQWRMRVAIEATRQRIEDRLVVREHIAQELHDTLLQGFQGLVLRFQSLLHRLPPGHPIRPDFEATLDRADDVLQEGRDRVRWLRQAIEPVELASLLSNIARATLDSQLRWSLKQSGVPRPVCAPVADDIARIAGEALSNALRHAQASKVTIELDHGRDNVTVTIADDGIGIDPAVRAAGRKDGHYGLVGMKERGQRLGASLDISDGDPGGTEVRIVVPARVAYR